MSHAWMEDSARGLRGWSLVVAFLSMRALLTGLTRSAGWALQGRVPLGDAGPLGEPDSPTRRLLMGAFWLLARIFCLNHRRS